MLFLHIFFYFVLYFSCLNCCVGWQLCSRLWAWNGLPLNTYISMYARMNRCYKERGSRTSYVRSSIPHCINENRLLNFRMYMSYADVTATFYWWHRKKVCGVWRWGFISLLLKNSVCIGNCYFSCLLLSLCWQPIWVTVPITPDAKNSKTLYMLENLLCIVRK